MYHSNIINEAHAQLNSWYMYVWKAFLPKNNCRTTEAFHLLLKKSSYNFSGNQTHFEEIEEGQNTKKHN